MRLADHWSYAGNDSCCEFWQACIKASNLDVPENAHVLEIGCAEFDWLKPASQSFPNMTFDGIDWRCKAPHQNLRVTRIKGDVREPERYPPNTFDWIVSISTIEHIGLGHYAHDPKDDDGDIVAMANAYRWLKPGGWILFDVPYDRTGYRVQGTECRVYDDDALFLRLWCEPLAKAKAMARWHQTYYCEVGHESVLIEKPTQAMQPFHYVAVLAQKVG